MNKYKFLISNTGLFFISTFSSKFLVFLLMPIYTAVLTPDEFGAVDLMIQTANLLIPVVSLGISNSVIRFGLDKNYSKKGVFTTATLVLLTGFTLLVVAFPILNKISFINQFIFYLYLYLFMSCMRTLVQQFTRAKAYTKLYAVDGILATVSTLVLVYVFLIKLKLGAIGYILATIGADFISIIFLSVISNCWRYFSLPKVNKKLTKEMLYYCLPLIPASIFWWVTNVSDRYLVTYFVGEAANGIYAISYKLPSIVMIFATVFTEAWQISAVKESGKTNTSSFFTNVFKMYQSVIFIAGAGLILLCKPLTSIMVSQEYYAAWQYMPILILATCFSCFSSFMSSIYMVEKNGKANLTTMLVGAVANVLINIYLIPKIGVQGAAIATFISYFLVFIIRVISTRKSVKVNISIIYMALNLISISLLSYFMIYEVANWVAICIVITTFIVIINFLPLLGFVKKLIKRIF